MANEKNLKPVRTEKEARELGRMGGIASGKARREKKKLRELANELLEREMPGADGTMVSMAERLLMVQANKALKGDTRAFTVLRDTAGQMPVQQVDVSATASTEAKFTELLEKFSGED